MQRWLSTVVMLGVLSGTAWAKKPKGPPPPPPEVMEAFGAYGDAAKVYYDAYQGADLYALQGLVWDLGDEALQGRLDALKARQTVAEEALMAANAAMNAAMTSQDIAAVRAVTASLLAKVDDLASLQADASALEADLVSAKAGFPTTIPMAELASVDMMRLQRIFEAAGWSKPNAGVGTMVTSGYSYANFDVAQDGKGLNVYVIRPDPSPEGTGGMPPKDVAAKSTGAFRYDAALDVFVEIRPGEGATEADAKALLDAVILP